MRERKAVKIDRVLVVYSATRGSVEGQRCITNLTQAYPPTFVP